MAQVSQSYSIRWLVKTKSYAFDITDHVEGKSCPDLAAIASQIANQSKQSTPKSSSIIQPRLITFKSLSLSMISDLPLQIKLHGKTPLAQYTRDCHRYLRALFPETDEVPTAWGESGSSTI